MKDSYDELELARTRVDAQIQTLRDEVERQFKHTLTHIVETHEGDRKNNLDRFLIRAALEYPADIFERLKGRIRSQFPSYISGINYSQGGSSSINFTSTPPPAVWESMVNMNKIFNQEPPISDKGFQENAFSHKSQKLPAQQDSPSSDAICPAIIPG
ncbi:hypothetical protein ColTof4_08781 [Colletotrichum tofieldiae]|nr:hypothetical protein ColTof3_04014 [Colletotrichum tofieldiae]GKT76358.1 hypothetical protein ColTof4_08781 [Colletotrichum tofieldiae]